MSIDEWIDDIKMLSKIAIVEPHIAYCTYVFGFQHKYTYFMRTLPNISANLKRLDRAIDEYIIKALFNGVALSYTERIWLSLPPRLGGLGLCIPSEIADIYYQNSKDITTILVDKIVNQHKKTYESIETDTKLKKMRIRNEKKKREEEKLAYVKDLLPSHKLKVLEATTEKGASSWLTTLPLKDQGFYLNKQTFWDTIYLRYGLTLSRLPLKCVCGGIFNIEHALSCKKGGFINIRHNELRDITAELLQEVCNDVSVETLLTPLSGETSFNKFKTANKDQHTRFDVSARRVWIKGSKAYFDIRVP